MRKRAKIGLVPNRNRGCKWGCNWGNTYEKADEHGRRAMRSVDVKVDEKTWKRGTPPFLLLERTHAK